MKIKAYSKLEFCKILLYKKKSVNKPTREGTDAVFHNGAARCANITPLKDAHGEDERVSPYARFDVWFTACIFFVSLPDGKRKKQKVVH